MLTRCTWPVVLVAALCGCEDPDDAYTYLTEESGFVVPTMARSLIVFLLEGNERTLMPPDGPLPQADVDSRHYEVLFLGRAERIGPQDQVQMAMLQLHYYL